MNPSSFFKIFRGEYVVDEQKRPRKRGSGIITTGKIFSKLHAFLFEAMLFVAVLAYIIDGSLCLTRLTSSKLEKSQW